jgi:hypothetical protein
MSETPCLKHFFSQVLSSGELAAAVEDAANLDIDPDLTSQLLNVPSRDRLGVQAVLVRHGQRVRSLSVSSDRSGQSDLRHRKVSEAGFSSKVFFISRILCLLPGVNPTKIFLLLRFTI